MREDAPVISPDAHDKYDTVLVAVVNNWRDFAILCNEHWYRIPVQRVPRRAIGAPIIAFYHTRAFQDEKWAIHYCAEAQMWETVKRLDLFPDELSHPRAHNLYYKVHLGELRRLPHPIVSDKWRRITFIVTHWERLMQAREISELTHGNIWDEAMWKALRQIGLLAERFRHWLSNE
ncbi:MAG: hypothetical protein H5T64_07615 [Chloroflexi bacterium]|nr:hypothetical protein [Chloroflexota bacterium]